MTVSRRALLLAAAAAALPLSPARSAVLPAETIDRLRRLVSAPESARQIGLAYLAAAPQEAESGMLARRTLAALGLDETELAASEDSFLRHRLAARLSADFGEGEVTRVGGWLLSRTELRLCALCAMSA